MDPRHLQDEQLRAAANRNYVLYAVLVLVLYAVLYVPGLIANIVFYLQASNDEKLLGRPPEGKGCLLALLIVFIALPIIGGCVLVFFMFAAAIGSG
jgi:hypothetical protein